MVKPARRVVSALGRPVQRRLCGRGGDEHFLPVRAHAVGEVGVQVDQPGQDGGVAEVDDVVGPGGGGFRARRRDAVAGDEDGAGLDKGALAVDHPGRADEGGGFLPRGGVQSEAERGESRRGRGRLRRRRAWRRAQRRDCEERRRHERPSALLQITHGHPPVGLAGG